jgi:hypothetical protein
MRSATLTVAASVIIAAVRAQTSTPFSKVLLPTSKALDGGPALYYIDTAAAGSSDADRWIVFLEGGGICQHQSDCYSRKAGFLGSASQWPDEWTPSHDQDILSNDADLNPDFAGWNHVFVPYVSGDIWLGTQSTPWNPWSDTNQVESGCDGFKDDSYGTLAAAGSSCAAVITAGATCDMQLSESVPGIFGPGAPLAQYGGMAMTQLCGATCATCDPDAADTYVMEGHNILEDTITQLIAENGLDGASSRGR